MLLTAELLSTFDDFSRFIKFNSSKTESLTPLFYLLVRKAFRWRTFVPNMIEALPPGNETPGNVFSFLGSKMADRKWLSVLFFGTSSGGIKMCFLLKFGDDISSRFGDSGRKVGNSRWRPAAILDFLGKQKSTFRLFFCPLSSKVDRFSIVRLGAEIWRPVFELHAPQRRDIYLDFVNSCHFDKLDQWWLV